MTLVFHQFNRFDSYPINSKITFWTCYLFNESANVPVVNRLLTESHNRNDWFQKMRLYLLSCPRKKILHFNNKTPSIIVYWRSLHFIPYVTMIGHWARKFNDQMYAYPLKKFHPTDHWLNRLCEYFFRGSYPQKPCAIGKDLTVFIKEIGVSRRILVIQFASIFCNRLIFLLTKSQHSYIWDSA